MSSFLEIVFFDLLLVNIFKAYLFSYPFILFFYKKKESTALNRIAGGTITRISYYFIVILFLLIITIQKIAGCSSLLGECYNENIKIDNWYLWKDFFRAFVFVWLSMQFYRLIKFMIN